MQITKTHIESLMEEALIKGGSIINTSTSLPLKKKEGYLVTIENLLSIDETESLDKIFDLENGEVIDIESDEVYLTYINNKSSDKVYVDLALWVKGLAQAVVIAAHQKQPSIYSLELRKELQL